MSRVLIIDVDGVINVDQDQWSDIELLSLEAPPPVAATIYVHPNIRIWMRRLVDAADEIVWNTSWNELASQWLGPAIGMPSGLRWIDQPRTAHVTWGRSSKLIPVLSGFSETDQIAALEDVVGGKDPDIFADRGWFLPDVTDNGRRFGRGITDSTVKSVEAYFREGLPRPERTSGETSSAPPRGLDQFIFDDE